MAVFRAYVWLICFGIIPAGAEESCLVPEPCLSIGGGDWGTDSNTPSYAWGFFLALCLGPESNPVSCVQGKVPYQLYYVSDPYFVILNCKAHAIIIYTRFSYFFIGPTPSGVGGWWRSWMKPPFFSAWNQIHIPGSHPLKISPQPYMRISSIFKITLRKRILKLDV